MNHGEYRDVCSRKEHKDLPVMLRNTKTGEVGSLVQCSVWDSPEGFLVKVGGEDLCTWYPQEVEEM